MAEKQVSLSVRIDEDLHQAVKIRAFKEKVAVEALLRGWLKNYAAGPQMAVPEVVKVPVEAMGYPTEADLPPLVLKPKSPKAAGPEKRERWSIVCSLREHHIKGVTCPECKGNY